MTTGENIKRRIYQKKLKGKEEKKPKEEQFEVYVSSFSFSRLETVPLAPNTVKSFIISKHSTTDEPKAEYNILQVLYMSEEDLLQNRFYGFG